jgi:hypothetical protein
MKARFILLFAAIPSFIFSQETNHGSISLMIADETLEIPVSQISVSRENGINIQAFGKTTEPTISSTLLSLSFFRLTTNPTDLNLTKCLLTISRLQNNMNTLYLSFGFKDAPMFYYEKYELDSKTWKFLTDNTMVHILSIITKFRNQFITGRFASVFIAYDKKGRIKKRIEISNGQFTLIIESPNIIVPKIVERPMETILTLSPPEIEPDFNLPTFPELQPTVRVFIIDQPTPAPQPESTRLTTGYQRGPSDASTTTGNQNNHRTTMTGRGSVESNVLNRNQRVTREVTRNRQTIPTSTQDQEKDSRIRDYGVRRSGR